MLHPFLWKLAGSASFFLGESRALCTTERTFSLDPLPTHISMRKEEGGLEKEEGGGSYCRIMLTIPVLQPPPLMVNRLPEGGVSCCYLHTRGFICVLVHPKRRLSGGEGQTLFHARPTVLQNTPPLASDCNAPS